MKNLKCVLKQRNAEEKLIDAVMKSSMLDMLQLSEDWSKKEVELFIWCASVLCGLISCYIPSIKIVDDAADVELNGNEITIPKRLLSVDEGGRKYLLYSLLYFVKKIKHYMNFEFAGTTITYSAEGIMYNNNVDQDCRGFANIWLWEYCNCMFYDPNKESIQDMLDLMKQMRNGKYQKMFDAVYDIVFEFETIK